MADPAKRDPATRGWFKNKNMYVVYILKSFKNGRYYVGHTNDIERRLKQHNNGFSVYTKKYIPWSLIYTEEFETRSLAIKRDLEIKKYKGGIKFKKLLGLFEE